MEVTFIGGPLHGKTQEMRDDTKSFLAAIPVEVGAEGATALYLKQTWHNPQTGDHPMMVWNMLPDSEIDAKARPLMQRK